MNERIHALDWSSTPLGPLGSWPASLRSTVDMLVACDFPMIALWGPELSQIYNDGYAAIMAAKHPGGLGQATRDCWPEVWHFNLPIYERVLGGETVTLENQLFPITRHGYVEDAYFTLCYSPLRDEAGGNSGVLVTVFETTQRLRAERELLANATRQMFLLTLTDATRQVSNSSAIAEITCRLLAEHMHGSRVQYVLVEGARGAEVAEVYGEFVLRGAPLLRHFPMAPYGEAILAPLRDGHTLVLNDCETDPRLSAEERKAFRQIDSPAAIAVPLNKGGRFAGTFTIHDVVPRQWTPDEIALVEGVAERTWAAAERAHAESALRESEEKLRAYTRASSNALYEMSADWSSMSQLDGDVFLANTKSADSDWLNKYIHPLDQPQVQEAIREAIETKSPFELEHRVLRVDGTLGWTFSRAIPILDDAGTIRSWFGAASDITDRKLMELAMKQKEKLAAVGQIASTIAHEINNPLESVTNLLYLARNSTENPQAVEYLDIADLELRRVAAITSQTLRFHRQLTKATSITAEALFSASVNTYQGRLHNSYISVEQRYRASGTFHCLEGEIQQVLNNLIGNAVHAMGQQGGRLLLRSADVFDRKTGQSSVRMTVADTGTGIPHEIVQEVFHAFFTTKGANGTGLGLWISKEIVDRHQGRLCVRSSTRSGRTGTVFTVLLPKQLASQRA